jgi:hypothetical protein
MKKIPWVTFACIALITGQALALEITSLAPVRGTPGTQVGISGGPFSLQTQPFLGENYVAPRIISENHMNFTVPNLPPGNYALTVQDNTMVAAQTYQFEVMFPTPQVTKINPSILDACSIDPLNQLQINGRNFRQGAVLLVNDRVVPSRFINATTIEAKLPKFQKPGVYGVSVSNRDGATSLPHSLWVNSTPEINSVERGADFVNHYEVIIHGKNFQFDSTLVVKEPEDSTLGQTYQRLSSLSPKSAASQVNVSPQGNRLTYVDCQTLIYYRYRTSQTKELGLQVFNSDGRKSDQYSVDLP